MCFNIPKQLSSSNVNVLPMQEDHNKPYNFLTIINFHIPQLPFILISQPHITTANHKLVYASVSCITVKKNVSLTAAIQYTFT